MGRPLKIQKYGSNQGILSGSTAAAVPVDQGYPNFGSLTNPVYNSPDTLTSSQFVGVVGGAPSAATSATYPRVKVRVFITGFAEEDGYIIRQKGSHKYLVGGTTARTALVSGSAYRITVVGDTDWASYGVQGTAAVGTIFTATAALADTGTGRVNAVGVCVLTSDLSPTAGLMSISFFNDDSTEQAISRLTNKYLQAWTNFANAAGTSLTTYADDGNNLGVVNYSNEPTLLSNFFTDEGGLTKSGADLATAGVTVSSGTFFDATGLTDLAIVENSTATS
jgi:hypothetical protein